MNEQRFPKGWDEQRVKQLIAELDARTEDEWIAADGAVAVQVFTPKGLKKIAQGRERSERTLGE